MAGVNEVGWSLATGEQGQPLALAAVLKVHVTAGHLVAGRILDAADVTVYVVDVESAAVGLSDSVLVGPSYAVVAATGVGPLARLMTTVLGSTLSLKVAVTVVLVVPTPVAPGAGWRSTTVGFVVSVALVSKTTSTQ